jgi:hypothetical protein
MARSFSKNVEKYGAWQKNCSQQHEIKFQQKCRWNGTAAFAPFTLCLRLCEMHKLIGEIDSWSLSQILFTIVNSFF